MRQIARPKAILLGFIAHLTVGTAVGSADVINVHGLGAAWMKGLCVAATDVNPDAESRPDAAMLSGWVLLLAMLLTVLVVIAAVTAFRVVRRGMLAGREDGRRRSRDRADGVDAWALAGARVSGDGVGGGGAGGSVDDNFDTPGGDLGADERGSGGS